MQRAWDAEQPMSLFKVSLYENTIFPLRKFSIGRKARDCWKGGWGEVMPGGYLQICIYGQGRSRDILLWGSPVKGEGFSCLVHETFSSTTWRDKWGGEERNNVFFRYMGEILSSSIIQQNLGCSCYMWRTSHDMDYHVIVARSWRLVLWVVRRGMELRESVYSTERAFSASNPAVLSFRKKLPWSHPTFCVIQF